MTKAQFCDELRRALGGMLPEADIEKWLAFYTETIDDRIEDGMSEEDAVAAAGTIENITLEILGDTPLPTLVREKVKPKHRLNWFEITLIILGFPVWLSLLIAFFAVVLAVFVSVYAVLFSLIISLYAVVLALGVSAIALGVVGVIRLVTLRAASGALLAGSALICAGLAILLFMVSGLAAKGVIFTVKSLGRGIKYCIVGKGRSK